MIIACATLEALEDHVEAWRGLATALAETNIFYHPDVLIPAITCGIVSEGWKIYFMYEQQVLIAVFPTVTYPRRGLWPFRHEGMLTHAYCFRGSPLILSGKMPFVIEKIEEVLGKSVFVLPLQYGQDEFFSTLLKQRALYVYNAFERPAYNSTDQQVYDFSHYLKDLLDAGDRKKFKSKEKKLLALGAISLEELPLSATEIVLEDWITDFLNIEASGWKGSQGTALLKRETDKQYFYAVCRALHQQGMLTMRRLRLNQELTLAISCGFAHQLREAVFKIAYNQAYSAYSPGVMLEYLCLQKFTNSGQRMSRDSCTNLESRTFQKLWPGRLDVRSAVVVPSTYWRRLLFRCLVAVRSLR